MPDAPTCRFCSSTLKHTFVDLGTAPPCQNQIAPADLHVAETYYPLHVRVCHECFLVQLPNVIPPEAIFGTGDYAYFSSYSDSWLQHAEHYAQEMIGERELDSSHLVVEVASNDGYLLQYFHGAGIPVLGIEPASNCAQEAGRKGIESVIAFFGLSTAQRVASERGKADLLIGNNVLAHVPNINDFVAGLKHLLADDGTITMEFPHLVRLIEQTQYDTIYHEHYSYLSLYCVNRIFRHHGLRIFDVRPLSTHGGSIRIYATHESNPLPEKTDSMRSIEREESSVGIDDLTYYQGFGRRVAQSKRDVLQFLIDAANQGKQVVGYGAPGKGNTMLNYCGIRPDLLAYTVDRNPHKQGHFTPGCRIPIYDPSRITQTQPDYVLILPWNLKDEIVTQMNQIRQWGGKFVVAIPTLEIVTP